MKSLFIGEITFFFAETNSDLYIKSAIILKFYFMFTDRYDAAKQLVKKLEKYNDTDAVIIAIPRGGVPLGHYIAKTLGLPLEISLSKK